MCGINGVISKQHVQIRQHSIEKMNKTLNHRGPDDHGVYLQEHIGLGHTRLSILDLSSAGHQPMIYDEKVIVYNGEVYNFKEIRNALVEEGIVFHSESDTEVILKAYAFYGIEFVNQLNGMFSLAIFDPQKEKIFLIRDRYGIKPLYLYEDTETIIFSSEIKSILTQNVKVSIDKKAIEEYFQFHYIRHPRTPYNEIQKVEPGYIYEIDVHSFKVEKIQYYSIDPEPDTGIDFETASEKCEEILADSVKLRMISDVEVGLFLSGGVDSSLITALAAECTERKLKTFSIAFKGVSDFFDESKYALEIAQKYGTDHKVLYMDFNDLLNDLDTIVAHMDEPLADSSVFLNYQLSKLTKEYVTVVLSGLGGDELFGGYNRHQAFLIQKKLQNMKFLKFFSKIDLLGSTRTGRYGNTIRHLAKLLDSVGENANETYLKTISYHFLNSYDLGISHYKLENILLYDTKYYMSDNLLNFTDKMSMMHSLEIRTPFLDYRLVDYAFSLNPVFKASLFEKKIILKKIAEKYMSKDSVYRRKQGFAAPIEIWLRKMGRRETEKLMDLYILKQYIDIKLLEEDIFLFFNKEIDRSMQIYAYIIFSKWHHHVQSYIDE